MIVLVTGAAGFIGSHTCERLLLLGYTVVGLDNINDFYSVDQKRQNLTILQQYPEFRFREVDVCSLEQLVPVFAAGGITHIVHLAGRGGVAASMDNPFVHVNDNITGTLTLLEASKNAGVELFVNASSSSIYGEVGLLQCQEGRRTDSPTSVYAATKKCTELLTYTYHHVYRMGVVNVRFFSVYGPRGRPDQVVHRLTRMIDQGLEIPWIEPEPTRDFTYIDDIVDGLIAIIRGSINGYHSVNLGSGRPALIRNVVHLLENALGKPAHIGRVVVRQPFDLSASFADMTLAKDMFGWSPKTTLSMGLAQFAEWYLRYRA